MTEEIVVGLEIHVELSTRSKLFCGCPARFGERPNALCCPICAGHPGTLPRLNRGALEAGLRLGLAFGGKAAPVLQFDRKNYFYPDLPKGYQITQRRMPVIHGGFLEIGTGEGTRKIHIHEAHIEEDAGKLSHDPARGLSLIDLNRAGVPLLEVVTEPELRSGEEAAAFARKLRDLAVWLGVSRGKMQEGNLRADVNVSLTRDGVPGERTEIKNVASFREIQRAVELESLRQHALYEAGEPVERVTLRYDGDRDRLSIMREKEEESGYRYSPEPDLPPVVLDPDWVEQLRAGLGTLPREREREYLAWGLEREWITVLLADRELSRLLDRTVSLGAGPREAAAWILVDAQAIARARGWKGSLPTPAETFAYLIRRVEEGQFTRAVARKLLEEVFEGEDPEETARRLGLKRIGREEIEAAVETVIREGGKALQDYRAGKEKAFTALMGRAMGILRGQGDPTAVREALRRALEK